MRCACHAQRRRWWREGRVWDGAAGGVVSDLDHPRTGCTLSHASAARSARPPQLHVHEPAGNHLNIFNGKSTGQEGP